MEKIEIIFQALRNLVGILIADGVLAVVSGILIFIYPDLLGMLVGLLLIVTGIILFIGAAKIRKYSKVEIKL